MDHHNFIFSAQGCLTCYSNLRFAWLNNYSVTFCVNFHLSGASEGHLVYVHVFWNGGSCSGAVTGNNVHHTGRKAHLNVIRMLQQNVWSHTLVLFIFWWSAKKIWWDNMPKLYHYTVFSQKFVILNQRHENFITDFFLSEIEKLFA